MLRKKCFAECVYHVMQSSLQGCLHPRQLSTLRLAVKRLKQFVLEIWEKTGWKPCWSIRSLTGHRIAFV